MEQNPSGMNFSAEKFSDDKDKKKKGKSKRFGFVAPVVEAPEPKAETRKESPDTDKKLAELLFARDKQEKPEEKGAKSAEVVGEIEEPKEAATETSEEALDAEEARKKLEEAFNTDYKQEIKANELPPNKIFSEGIIDLGHDDELVVALRQAEQEQPQTEFLQLRAQPEQQHQARSEMPGEDSADASAVESEPGVVEPAEDTPEHRFATATPPPEVEPPAPTPTNPQPQGQAPRFTSLNQPPVSPNVVSAPNPNAQPSAPNIANLAAPNVVPNPNVFGAIVPGATNYNQAPPASSPNVVDKNKYVTKEEYDDGVYYATKYGQRRGVLAGLTVAGYEHFKHRRRERKLNKKLQEQGKATKKTNEQHRFETIEQKKLLNEKERQLSEMQAAAARQPKPEVQPVAAQPERPTVAAERVRTARPEKKAENRFTTQLEKLVPKRPERAKTAEVEPSEQLEVPPEHHLEASAWHTIEVDTKTGKAVETPAFAYGEEYYRERAKETRQRTDGQKQAAGEVAIVAAALAEKPAAGANGQASGQAAPSSASTQQRANTRQVIAAKTKNVFRAGKAAVGGSGQQNTGPLWPWLLAFAVVVVLLIVVL